MAVMFYRNMSSIIQHRQNNKTKIDILDHISRYTEWLSKIRFSKSPDLNTLQFWRGRVNAEFWSLLKININDDIALRVDWINKQFFELKFIFRCKSVD